MGSVISVLASGGLDSCVLVGDLLRQGRTVQPIYVRSHLIWETAELGMLQRFLRQISTRRLHDLVQLDLPLADLYGQHWSVTGKQTPDRLSSDEAVYLPGRNALLVLKAALWCHLNGIPELALGPLTTSPFPDASMPFFEHMQAILRFYTQRPPSIQLPFVTCTKRDVMQLGRDFPLDLTFSCLAPVRGNHCGQCNKCEERRRAFVDVGIADPTYYAAG